MTAYKWQNSEYKRLNTKGGSLSQVIVKGSTRCLQIYIRKVVLFQVQKIFSNPSYMHHSNSQPISTNTTQFPSFDLCKVLMKSILMWGHVSYGSRSSRAPKSLWLRNLYVWYVSHCWTWPVIASSISIHQNFVVVLAKAFWLLCIHYKEILESYGAVATRKPISEHKVDMRTTRDYSKLILKFTNLVRNRWSCYFLKLICVARCCFRNHLWPATLRLYWTTWIVQSIE